MPGRCVCLAVMVAEPSLAFLMRLKLSTMTPMKRFIAKSEPTNIQSSAYADGTSAASSRTGAAPGAVASISENMSIPQSSPVLIT